MAEGPGAVRFLGYLFAARLLTMVVMLSLVGAVGFVAYRHFPLAHECLDTLGHAARVVLGFVNRVLKGLS